MCPSHNPELWHDGLYHDFTLPGTIQASPVQEGTLAVLAARTQELCQTSKVIPAAAAFPSSVGPASAIPVLIPERLPAQEQGLVSVQVESPGREATAEYLLAWKRLWEPSASE